MWLLSEVMENKMIYDICIGWQLIQLVTVLLIWLNRDSLTSLIYLKGQT